MTFTYQESNVNKIFPKILKDIHNQSEHPSRNGPVKRFLDPVCITYEKPSNRILFDETRDANPFFHFFETLWMLDGRNDLEFLLPFNARMAEYSDDGKLVRGSAYGARWRNWFKYDQLQNIVERLRKDPYDRRTVLTMWDAATDLTIESKDVPCNTHCYFSFAPAATGAAGYLDLTVCNRSNDLIYGCCGSNVFHFSFLLDYVAGLAGFSTGHYNQFTNNLHLYLENPTARRCLKNLEGIYDAGSNFVYPTGSYPIFTAGVDPDGWRTELNFFLRTGSLEDFIYYHKFFPDVAYPLWKAHKAYKQSAPNNLEGFLARYSGAMAWVVQCKDQPLALACAQWLGRRRAAMERKYG